IDDDARGIVPRLLDGGDHFAFAVPLLEIDGKAQGAAMFLDHASDVVEAFAPVNLRLTGAEEIEIGAVQDQYGLGFALSHNAFASAILFLLMGLYNALAWDCKPRLMGRLATRPRALRRGCGHLTSRRGCPSSIFR